MSLFRLAFTGLIACLAIAVTGAAQGESTSPAAGAAPGAASITFVPPESDLVIFVDLRALVNHPLTREVFEQNVKSGDQKHLEELQTSMGLDIRKDVNALVLFGSSKNPDKLTVGVLGNFEPEKLIGIAALTEGYETLDVEGLTVHHVPESDKSYIAFPDNHLALVADDVESIENALAARKASESHFAKMAHRFQFEREGRRPLVWMYADKPDVKSLELPGILGKATVEYLSVFGFLDDKKLDLEGQLRIKEQDLAVQMKHGLQGLLAVAQMAVDEPEVRDLLNRVKIDSGPDTNTIALRFQVDSRLVEDLVAQKHSRQEPSESGEEPQEIPLDEPKPPAPPSPPKGER
jgi:hypothetical protein